jgi:hypothetical protein
LLLPSGHSLGVLVVIGEAATYPALSCFLDEFVDLGRISDNTSNQVGYSLWLTVTATEPLQKCMDEGRLALLICARCSDAGEQNPDHLPP